MRSCTHLLYLTLFSLLLWFVSHQEAYAHTHSFFGDSRRGWFWFENRLQENESNKNKIEAHQTDPLKSLTQFQADLEARKAAMIMQPTLENTKRYIQLQNEMFLKASVVSQNWQKALILHPELNIVKDSPISEPGMAISRKIEQNQMDKDIKDFAKEFSLLFFYSSTCKYCEGFAHVVEHFSKKYGYKVAAVTLDGKKIKGFNGVYDANLIKKLNVQFTPALFAFSTARGVIVPVAQGFLPIDLLERNILTARKLVESRND